MRYFKGLVVFIVILIVSSIIFAIISYNDYARITALDYSAVVVDEPGSRGKVIITERLTFDIHAASEDNLFWELWRDLPEEYVDGVKVEYKVNSVKQIFNDKPDLIYEETPNLYWWDNDYISTAPGYGPGKWHHSEGPFDDIRNFECVLFYVDGIYRDTVIFEIEYEMYNASLRYNDSAEFYVSLFAGNDIRYLRYIKGQFLFPNGLMPGAGNYNAYTYGTNAHAFTFTESTSVNPGHHTFLFELDESQLKFRPYNRYIEFALIAHGADRHIFTKYADINIYNDDNMLERIMDAQAEYEALPLKYRDAKGTLLMIMITAALLIVFAIYSHDKKLKKKYSFFQPADHIEYYRDIPSELDPCFAGTLVFSKHKATEEIHDGFAAVMLSLVQKGYVDLVKIKDNKKWIQRNVKIVIKYISPPVHTSEAAGEAENPDETPGLKPLAPTEELYFNLIRRYASNNELGLSELQRKIAEDYDHADAFVKNIKSAVKSIGITQGYFQKSEYRKHKNNARGMSVLLIVLGVIITPVANLISYQTRMDLVFGAFFILGGGLFLSAFLLYKFSRRYLLLTQFGEDEYAKWRGLYNFLDSETLMNERTVLDLAVWENYLIYATAFGISAKVVKALKLRCKETELSPVLRNPYITTRSFYVGGRSIRTATHTASYTARSGGHGGYGGGGRGGGGGGGGH